MIKLVCLIRRPRGIERASFVDWWLSHHSRVAARLPGLRRYVIDVAEPDANGREPAWDGVAELWFDSGDAMDRAFASAEGQACSAEDREHIGERVALITTEYPQPI